MCGYTEIIANIMVELPTKREECEDDRPRGGMMVQMLVLATQRRKERK